MKIRVIVFNGFKQLAYINIGIKLFLIRLCAFCYDGASD